ncbi:hypothetical protein BDR06DRAFT_970503 [Suillus hirtellus]|nr:hypothetical protein BDR06DRAFT_970503 [Suillus hirtellus]
MCFLKKQVKSMLQVIISGIKKDSSIYLIIISIIPSLDNEREDLTARKMIQESLDGILQKENSLPTTHLLSAERIYICYPFILNERCVPSLFLLPKLASALILLSQTNDAFYLYSCSWLQKLASAFILSSQMNDVFHLYSCSGLQKQTTKAATPIRDSPPHLSKQD